MYQSLFQDDFAKELREVYRAALCNSEPDVAEKAVLEEYADCLTDEEDAAVFWLALAHEQWKAGCLTQQVKDQATYWSTHGAELRFTEAAIQCVMQKLHEPMPSPKKRMPPKNIYKDWNDGDVFRYEWADTDSLPPEWTDRTLYVQKIGTYHTGEKDEPIVWFKLSRVGEGGDELGAFQRAEFLPMYTFDEDYFSVERYSPESERAEYAFSAEQRPCAFNQKRQVPVYRCWLSVRKTDLKRFHFVGNDPEPQVPRNEYIPRFAMELELVLSKTLEQDVARANLHLKKYWK